MFRHFSAFSDFCFSSVRLAISPPYPGTRAKARLTSQSNDEKRAENALYLVVGFIPLRLYLWGSPRAVGVAVTDVVDVKVRHREMSNR